MERLKSLSPCSEDGFHPEKIAELGVDLLGRWVIKYNDSEYEITEIEAFFWIPEVHEDPFVTKSHIAHAFGRWLIHTTGVDITMGCDQARGSIHLRGIKRLSDQKHFNGPHRCFEELFQDGGDVFGLSQKPILIRKKEASSEPIYRAPRVGLGLSEFSEGMNERINYILKPYRFIRGDSPDYADKYIALLFGEKIEGKKDNVMTDSSIYQKYLYHFDVGQGAVDLEPIWNVNSKLYRNARLLGYLASKFPEAISIE